MTHVAARPARIALAAVAFAIVIAVAAPAHAATAVSDSDGSLAYRGTWQRVWNTGVSDGQYHTTTELDASVAISFEGTSAAWIGTKGPHFGSAEVILDGQSVGTVTQYASSLVRGAVVWSRSGLADGSHTLVIRCLRAAPVASTGVRIDVDGFRVGGTLAAATPSLAAPRLDDDDLRVSFLGPWRPMVRTTSAGASHRYAPRGSASGVSARAIVRFTGTGVTWIGERSPSRGLAEVWLDGAKVATVDQRTSGTYRRSALWGVRGLPDAEHVLEIRAVGATVVDAFDIVGTPAVPPGLIRLEERDTRLSWSELWTSDAALSASGGALRRTSLSREWTGVAFAGTSVAWMAPRSPSGGYVRVYLDGAYQCTVDLWAPSARYGRVVWSRAGLAKGEHRVRLVASGTGSHAGADRAFVDSFVVNGTPGQAVTRVSAADPRLVFRGAWGTRASASVPDGVLRASRIGGSTMTARFRGRQITLVTAAGRASGRLAVSIDGGAETIVDTYRSTAQLHLRAWTSPVLSDGYHTLRVRATGTHSAASSGSVVAIEGLQVAGELVRPAAVSGRIRVQETSPLLARVGSWTAVADPHLLGGRAITASNAGARLYIEISGTSFTWYGTRSRAGGRARVWIDGQKVATVTLYTSGVPAERRVLFSKGGLSDRRHRVMIEVLGTHDAGSAGNVVTVDALETDGAFVQARRPTPFNYPWMTYIVIDKSECNLYWVKDGYLVKVYRCAVGKPSTQTPVGLWRIGMKYHTDPSGIYGPRKMRLFRKVGSSFVYTAYNIHGTNQEWVIGTWASHGCIRMYNREVLELFPQVPIGTMVITKN